MHTGPIVPVQLKWSPVYATAVTYLLLNDAGFISRQRRLYVIRFIRRWTELSGAVGQPRSARLHPAVAGSCAARQRRRAEPVGNADVPADQARTAVAVRRGRGAARRRQHGRRRTFATSRFDAARRQFSG